MRFWCGLANITPLFQYKSHQTLKTIVHLCLTYGDTKNWGVVCCVSVINKKNYVFHEAASKY